MSSPANHPVEGASDRDSSLEELMADDMRAAIVEHLLAEGEASVSELIDITSQEIASCSPTDHDRVRAAVALNIDHVPVLVEHELVEYTESEKSVAMGFLPSDTIQRLRAALK